MRLNYAGEWVSEIQFWEELKDAATTLVKYAGDSYSVENKDVQNALYKLEKTEHDYVREYLGKYKIALKKKQKTRIVSDVRVELLSCSQKILSAVESKISTL